MKIEALALAGIRGAVAALRPSEAADRVVAETVAGLLADVRARGDAALAEATARFDWPAASVSDLRLPEAALQAAYRAADPELLKALEVARENCTFFHRHELPADWEERGPQGQRLGLRHVPVERAGLYVPGGMASYASTVVMNAVPALVAGVKELVICTPPRRDGSVDDSVLAAAWMLGIRRVFRVGGAQAIAAMAYGTQTIPRVDVICGPGNAYVMEAKRQVYGAVGIDSLAGPSEVVVVADGSCRPEWVAADLLAQEEHGSGATAVLLAETLALCEQIREAVAALEMSGVDGSRKGAGGIYAFYPASGDDFLVLAEAFVNEYAPEHLELHVADPRALMLRVRAAGAVFLGGWSATAFGDYVAGSNHVLPTGGAARFSSPLSVSTFMRRSSVVELSEDAVVALSGHLSRMAESEGFVFHRLSAQLRAEAASGRPARGEGLASGPPAL